MSMTTEERLKVKCYHIYCLYCENTNDMYVGSTCNVVQRMEHHERLSQSSKQKKYQIIRDNGGWVNWDYDILDYSYCNWYEVQELEQNYKDILNPSMNKNDMVAYPNSDKIRKRNYKKTDKYKVSERRRKSTPEYKFQKGKARAILGLKRGRDVKESTLLKYHINRAEILGEGG